MKTLFKLYRIYNPSKGERNISGFVQNELDKMRIKYNVLRDGTIYSLTPSTPLICAHLDSVQRRPVTTIKKHKSLIYANGCMGADDKNGIWACLQILKYCKNISFIFSVQEEVGGNIAPLLNKYDYIMDKLKYGLVFDRCNGSDIICNANLYGSKRFEKQLAGIGKAYGYKPAGGVWSDADAISEYVSCANLSVGYYNHHTDIEYTLFNELVNAVKFGLAIIKKTKKRYSPAPVTTTVWKRSKYADLAYLDSPKSYRSDVPGHRKDYRRGNPDYLWVCVDCDRYFKDSALSHWEYCPFCGGFLVDEYYTPRNKGGL